ncbi:endonuclease/exonuclease/phosphatase family protein [Bacillus litorisediminis]|uniref:endonuclease/exonuclease/phosphatase family protein n=1 Tax=Bacillus litorisediminis TaxID=2922713 RepID=UPI001FB044F8|nr:endonuclease/exonuclease/phosphatase family protein [Bacillus litorisediminis]
MEVNVMSYNIHHGKGIDRKLDLNRIAEVINKSNADVIGLNEVDRYFSKRSMYEDQISLLAKQLQMDYVFSPSITLKSKNSEIARQYGNALLSKFPILKSKSTQIHAASKFREGRSILETAIEIDQKQLLQVLVTHISFNPSSRKKQIQYILDFVQQNPLPTVVIGDWNMIPGSKSWKKVAQKMQDVWHLSGKAGGYTYPSYRPRKRLDYLFITEEIKVVEAEVIDIVPDASDHLPVLARLEML